jgi:DNA-binding LacI/PurR family transcriptional regulator
MIDHRAVRASVESGFVRQDDRRRNEDRSHRPLLLKGLDCPMVLTDDVEVGMLATEHLIKLGHRRIGHLRGTHHINQ